MPQIVQKPGEAHFSHLFLGKAQMLGHPPGHVHGSQRMLEPAMARSWIDRLHQTQLLNSLQSLHRPGQDEMPLQPIYLDSPMNRVAKSVKHTYFEASFIMAAARSPLAACRAAFASGKFAPV